MHTYFQRLHVDLAFPGGFKLYQMVKVQALASSVGGDDLTISIVKMCPKTSTESCNKLLRVNVHTRPGQIQIGYYNGTSFVYSEQLLSPLEKDQIFEIWILTMEKGFWIVVNGKVIKADYPYKHPFTEDYYLYVHGGYPVLKIDIKSGFDWWRTK